MIARPAVDAITDKALIVLQDRQLVGFGHWLADVLRACGESGRVMQIVTPSTSRITMPLRLVLAGANSRWVVRAGSPGGGAGVVEGLDTGPTLNPVVGAPNTGTGIGPGYYDGLTGAVLTWDGSAFVPEASRGHHPQFVTPPNQADGVQLTVTFRVRHAPDIPVGGATEQMFLALAGAPPRSWGMAEPAGGRWHRGDLTQMFGGRGAQATWLTVTGSATSEEPVGGHVRPAVATMLVSASASSVEEAVTLVVGYDRPDETPTSALPTIVGALAVDHAVMSFFAQLAPGRADLTTEPRWAGPPAPIGMAVAGGMEGTRGGMPGQQIGNSNSPVVWYELGDGWSPDGWQRYEQLAQQLRLTQ